MWLWRKMVKKKTYVVTGGSGFLGRHLVLLLLKVFLCCAFGGFFFFSDPSSL